MPRPCKRRRIRHSLRVRYYKPQGVPLRVLDEVKLQVDEVEALRWCEVEGLQQKQAGERMGISQSTVARILASAYKKIAMAIVEGKAIVIEK